MLQVENIDEIVRVKDGRGYEIVFKDKRKIWVTKPRAIVALLVLIKYGEGNETDLANNSKKIPALKKILHARYPASLIRDHYGDANKPFSLASCGTKKASRSSARCQRRSQAAVSNML